jgi:hypothetical protein
LIAGSHSKAALQLAKDLHKRSACAESEALLTDAYKARIEDLVNLGMTVEAKALLGIVRERFPAVLPRLAELDREICALDGELDDVVAPLANAELPAEDRERIETFIRQRIHDLPALASVSSLPPEHPLRAAASALASAFQAVTKGPVEDGVLALLEVSRRSPLAPWKALIRAIASYYRREDGECSRWLRTIPDDSVPARLIPAMAAMLRTKPASGANFKLSLAEEKLLAAAADHGAALRSSLTALEDALHEKKQKRILEAAKTAMAASQHCTPAMRERLRQHIAVRAGTQRISKPAMEAAVGGAPRWDAYCFRLMARALEERQTAESRAEAVVVWADFRREAIKEKLFAAGGLEDGVLSLHMGRLIEQAPAEVVEDLRSEIALYGKPGKCNVEEDLPSPGTLYERACKADPHPEAFDAWLGWARNHAPFQVADHVAERWREARATDIQPLLYLMESAEKRNAFKKSLKYLEEAENLDRLNPAVRRAKLRLLLSAAIRHLQQRKAHLAQKEIEQIKTVPEVRPGEIAGLVAALRWGAAAVDAEKAVQSEREAELSEAMGTVAAHLLMTALAEAAKLGSSASLPDLKAAKLPAAELLAGVAKACVLGEWAGLSVALPRAWKDPLIAALKLPNCPADTVQMLTLGEAAVDSCAMEVGYAVSTAGLASGKAKAEFLFLRARSLPLWASLRREGCLTASLELARRERNTKLAGRILDFLSGKQQRERGGWGFGFEMEGDTEIASRPVAPELLAKILEEEQTLEQFPGYNPGREPKYADDLDDSDDSDCDCPACRARRGAPEGMEFVDDEDGDEDEDEFAEEFDQTAPPSLKQFAEMLDEYMGALPPAMAQAVALQLKKAMQDGEDPFTAIDRVVGKFPLSPKSPAGSKKTTKLAPPEQGSLF